MDTKIKTLIIGTLAGAAVGLAGALLLTRRAEETGSEIAVSTGDGMRLGVMIIGLLRAVAALGEDKDSKKEIKRITVHDAGTQSMCPCV